MLLKQIKLENIRSYTNESINFSAGASLLSGDIGSGKSTILQAIEFALFGASRPDLPAESLLRKGSTHGSVDLSFSLNGKEISIRREIKKDKDSVKQLPGHLIINSIRKELTPVELKAEIITLLGYPKELAGKSRNYIYRYSVYTPQEEMKFILQDDAENRLDVLRKVFNIDKYKAIRENLQVFLRKARSEMDVLQTRIEPLPQLKEQLQKFATEKEQLELAVKEIVPLVSALREEIKQQKEELEILERGQKELQELKHSLKGNLLLLNEKKEQSVIIARRQELLKNEISAFAVPENKNLEELKLELKETELQKNSFLLKKNSLENRLGQVQAKIKELQQEMAQIGEKTAKIGEKEQLKEKLAREIAEKENLLGKRKELNELLETTSEVIVKNKTLLLQSKEMQEKIISLEKCPACLQNVPESHKEHIIGLEKQKSEKAEQLLQELNRNKAEISLQRDKAEKEIIELVCKENSLLRLELEISHLLENRGQLELKKETLKHLTGENSRLAEEIKKLNEEDQTKELNGRTQQIQEAISLLQKKAILERNHQELNQQLELNQKISRALLEKISEIESKLSGREDLTLQMEQKKGYISERLEKEKNQAVQLAKLETSVMGLKKQEETAFNSFNKLNIEKEKLIRFKETYNWLEGHFLKLTQAIEKQVMINIHSRFSQMFREWFSVLIDDENISSRIDDSFTPIIEQNGYEINFSSLSGGEKTSASLAYRLALNRVINDVISEINTKSLLILDEPTDGFSSEQLDKVREVLDKLNLQQTIIVSHEAKIESFVENIIRIRKEGQVSCVMG